ncbi:MAG: WbqC family protein [Anaerolineae bacterium]|nr:WbqC family protein [Anaerolineae bacterium]
MISLADIQPTFLPWRGYFDIIHKVDIFVFYDDAQYDRRSWRNRNRIKTPNGSQWITVPVLTKGKYFAPINEILIDNRQNWQHNHLKTIHHCYSKAPYFEQFFPLLVQVYEQPWERISDLDIYLTKMLADILGIRVQWVVSSDLKLTSRSTDRLVDICLALGADRYLSGPSAQAYIEPEKFKQAGITLEYQIYNYPPYPQINGIFDPHISVIDLLFNCGPDAPNYIWGTK